MVKRKSLQRGRHYTLAVRLNEYGDLVTDKGGKLVAMGAEVDDFNLGIDEILEDLGPPGGLAQGRAHGE